jgi:hypothetical protein
MLNKTPPSFGQRQNGPRPRTIVGRAPGAVEGQPLVTVAPMAAPRAADPPAADPSSPAAEAAAPCVAPAMADPGAEARWARRTPSRVGAQILHQSLSAPMTCTVRDTSSTGARLEVVVQRGGNISRDRVPDQFTLFMPADRLEVDCQVMWRQGALMGVRYVSPARRTAKAQAPKPAEAPKKPHTSLINLLINPL